MAKKDKELIKALRSGGVRKKVARELSDAASEAKHGKPSKEIRCGRWKTSVSVVVLEERVREALRSQGGRMAARTRNRTRTSGAPPRRTQREPVQDMRGSVEGRVAPE